MLIFASSSGFAAAMSDQSPADRIIEVNTETTPLQPESIAVRESPVSENLAESAPMADMPTVPTGVTVAVVVAFVLTIVGIFWLGHPAQWLQDGAAAIEGSGPLAPLLFAGLYIVSTVFLLPASVLTIGAGYIFGTFKGTAIVSVASTAGATLAFLVARYLARPIVAKQLSRRFRAFDKIDEAIAKDGWKIVFLWRLSPLFPFGASNYMFGLTGVNVGPYVLASWVAMLPATFTFVYLGSAGRATVDVITGDPTADIGPAKLALYVVGAVATLLVTREVSSRATKALEDTQEQPP